MSTFRSIVLSQSPGGRGDVGVSSECVKSLKAAKISAVGMKYLAHALSECQGLAGPS